MRWLFIFFSLPLFGVYVGNPADPGIMNMGFFSTTYSLFKFTSGYIYDYTSDKRYVASQKDPNFDPNVVKRFGLHSQMASFSFILLERLQLYGTIGGSKEFVEQREVTMSDFIFKPHTSYQFSWSAGGKAILFQWGQTFLSTDFTYFEIPPSHQTFFEFLNRLNLPLQVEKQKLSLDEWQLSLGLSSRFVFLTPYGGVTYLHSTLHVQEGPDISSLNYRNQVNWGFFYGLTLSLTGRFHLNFERRVRDEFAYTFSTIAVF
jgi:hypothetical protein